MSSSSNGSKVLLPTFEQMMRMVSEQGAAADAQTPPEEAAHAEASKSAEQEAELPQGPAPEELLREAQAQCEAMLQEAARQAEAIIEEAQQESLRIAEETRSRLEKEAQEKLSRELAELKKTVLASAQALDEAKDALFDALEPRLLDTAIHIAERILRYELERDEKAYLSIVRNVLEQSFSRQEVVLYLPVERYEQLMGSTEGEETPFALEMAKRGVEVRRDSALDPWDCLVTTDMGSVRGGPATQLARVRTMAGGGERV